MTQNDPLRRKPLMPTDLSAFHQPISDFLSASDLTGDLDRFRLTPEHLEHYDEFGYVAGVRIFSDEQVERLTTELAQLFDPQHDGHELWHEYHSNEAADPSTVLFHALGVWRIQPSFHDALWHPAFTVAASQLLGGAVRFWHDQLFCKPARHGGVVAWHQDYSYWTRSQPMSHLTCWIGLDQATRDNGCMLYVPGSHKWSLLPITGLAGDMNAIQQVLSAEQWEQFQHPVAIELQRGECTFHHPLMVHGSRENRTQCQRRAFVINCQRDGVRSATNEPLLQGVPVIPSGERIEGQFFPLLSDHSRGVR